MAGNPPVELKLEQIESEGLGGFGDVSIIEHALLEGENQTFPLWFDKDTDDPPVEGQVVKGWWSNVKSGKNTGARYFRRAEDKARSNGGGYGQSKANVAGQRWSSCLEKGATLYEYGRTEGVIDKPNNLDDIVTAVALLAGKLQATYPAEANE